VTAEPRAIAGVWQRFATNWAIVFTDSSHRLRGRFAISVKRDFNGSRNGEPQTPCTGFRPPGSRVASAGMDTPAMGGLRGDPPP
jgi:hypothetical protein